jgi:hypothetical protein
MRAWLFMLPICYAVSALLMWGALDVGERKWYRGGDRIKRLFLHSFILGAILAAVGPYLPTWWWRLRTGFESYRLF